MTNYAVHVDGVGEATTATLYRNGEPIGPINLAPPAVNNCPTCGKARQ